MSPLQAEVLLQMRLRGFAAKTVEAYIYALKELCRFYRRPRETLTCAEVQRFLDEIITVRKLAWATVNVYFSAYRFEAGCFSLVFFLKLLVNHLLPYASPVCLPDDGWCADKGTCLTVYVCHDYGDANGAWVCRAGACAAPPTDCEGIGE